MSRKETAGFEPFRFVTLKEGVTSAPRVLSFLHGDHPSTSLRAGLGSVSLTTDASGQKVSEQRYKPYGEVRWSSGAGMPTDKQFTSQTRLAEGYVGTLYDYIARAYDPVLGRFISADTIVPGAGNPAAFNRYMYVRGNPLAFIDPDGHVPYRITIRSFAPFAEFGFGFHGDNRGFSSSPSASARVHQEIGFDTDETFISNNVWCDSSSNAALPGVRMTERPRSAISGLDTKDGGDRRLLNFTSWYGASNPFTAGLVPRVLTEIDVYAAFTLIEDKDAGYLGISGELLGDNFPSTEAFITDQAGQSVFLGVGYYQGANKETAPFEQLPFSNKRQIVKFNMTIGLDSDGNFAYVLSNGIRYTLSDWNQPFERADPHSRALIEGGSK